MKCETWTGKDYGGMGCRKKKYCSLQREKGIISPGEILCQLEVMKSSSSVTSATLNCRSKTKVISL